MAYDGAACVAAGAAELHLHPREEDGRESLAAVGGTVAAVRRACPGTAIGVSTGEWIAGDVERTRAAITKWRVLPDHASVNLADLDAPAIIEHLRRRGVGIEAGLTSIADAERLARLPGRDLVLRVLIEIEEQDPAAARRRATEIAAVLDGHQLRRPILLHGQDASVWPLVRMAGQQRWSTRVGLEDGALLPDGTTARDNAALVAAAVAIHRSGIRVGSGNGPCATP